MISSHLQQIQLVGPARVGVLVPTAVRITDAAEAVVVTAIAHGQIDLLDAMIGANVEALTCLADFHHLDGLIGRNLEDIQQLGQRLAVAIILNNFVDATQIGAHVVNNILLIEDVNANSARIKYKCK